jgi:hypothetical protein
MLSVDRRSLNSCVLCGCVWRAVEARDCRTAAGRADERARGKFRCTHIVHDGHRGCSFVYTRACAVVAGDCLFFFLAARRLGVVAASRANRCVCHAFIGFQESISHRRHGNGRVWQQTASVGAVVLRVYFAHHALVFGARAPTLISLDHRRRPSMFCQLKHSVWHDSRAPPVR